MTSPRRRRTDKRRRARRQKGLVLIIILLLLFVMLLGAAVCYFVFIQPNNARVTGGQREAAALQGSLNRMTEEEIQEALNNIVDEGMFRISIASNIICTNTCIF